MFGRVWGGCGEGRAAEKCPCACPRPFPWAEQQSSSESWAEIPLQGSGSFDEGKSQGSKQSVKRRESALESTFKAEQDRTRRGTEACGSLSGTRCTKKEMLGLKPKDWNVAVRKVQTPSPPAPSVPSHFNTQRNVAALCSPLLPALPGAHSSALGVLRD